MRGAKDAALGVCAVLVGVGFALGPSALDAMTPQVVTALVALAVIVALTVWATLMWEDGRLGDILRRAWHALRGD